MTVNVTNNITPNYAIALPALSNRLVDDIPRLISAINTIDTVLLLKQDTSKAGAINGVATLDSGGRLTKSQLPEFIGDITSTAGSNTLNLSATGITYGTYNSVTVDTKGRVVAGTATPSVPELDGQAGKYLTNNGTVTAWSEVVSGINPTNEIASNYTAAANDLVRCNTTANAFNVIFPTMPEDGSIIGIMDVHNTFATRHVTIIPGSGTVENEYSYLLDINGAYVSFIYNALNVNWKLLQTPIELASINSDLPSQAGNNGNFLTTNGTTASWIAATNLVPTDVKTSNYTAVSHDLVRCNTLLTPIYIRLPAEPSDGSIISVVDINNVAGTNNIIILPNSSATIEYDVTSFTLDISNAYVTFIYSAVSSNWQLLDTPGAPATGGTSTGSDVPSANTIAMLIAYGG
jgi:hypothetical protein